MPALWYLVPPDDAADDSPAEAPVAPAGMTKFNTALLSVPALVTLAFVPGAPVVVVPTWTVAAVPSAPVAPFAPVAPVVPAGMTKFNTALLSVPVLVTLAFVPGAPVVVVPTCTVAAVPATPAAPVAPAGMTKFNTALFSVPVLVTLAFVPGAPVVVVPT